MRYLTDAIEIREFRKRYLRKLIRTYVQRAQSALAKFTFCTMCITVWMLCVVVMTATVSWFLASVA